MKALKKKKVKKRKPKTVTYKDMCEMLDGE